MKYYAYYTSSTTSIIGSVRFAFEAKTLNAAKARARKHFKDYWVDLTGGRCTLHDDDECQVPVAKAKISPDKRWSWTVL